VRDPATGQIISVDTTLTNSLAETTIKGWDVQVDYETDLDEIIAGTPGSLGVNLLLTLTDEYLSGGFDFAGTNAGGIGGATPDYKTVTTVDYRLDDWTFQVRHNYVPELVQFNVTPAAGPSPEFSNFDASVAWDVSDRFRVVGNISNLTDEFPPQIINGDQGNTDSALYAPWVVGRTFSVQARLKF
jgi:outer membrane receptor protein involved in Fe transport